MNFFAGRIAKSIFILCLILRRNKMDDLLKDAIADAKAVRETALANAKIALEEAFTPKIQSMLSQKIQSEVEEQEEAEVEEQEEEEVEEQSDSSEIGAADNVVNQADGDDEEDIEPVTEQDEEEVEEQEEEEVEEQEEEEVEEQEGEEVEEQEEEEIEEEEDELDLESILRELEEDEEAEELEEEEEVEEQEEEEVEEDEKQDEDELLAAADALAPAVPIDGSEVEEQEEEEIEEDDSDLDDQEEEIDLEEILRELSEEGEEEVEEDTETSQGDVSKLQNELEEHRSVVKYLRSKLNEVNLLNAKLLFTNKLFRAYGLNNEQKLKVVETFDRARNLREVKLVFSTLAESFGPKSADKPAIKESKGTASKAVASTKPKSKKVITEGSEMKDRFQKLANIL